MCTVSVLALPEILGKWAVCFASPLGWLAAMVLLGISYHQMYRRQLRKQTNSQRGNESSDGLKTHFNNRQQ